MGLFELVRGDIKDRFLSAHHLLAYMAEVDRGNVTAGEAATALGLNAGEIAEVTTLFTAVTGGTLTPAEVHDVMMLVESRMAPYDVKATAQTRLGL